MPFKPGDKVKHKSNGTKLVIIGIVGDGQEYPPYVHDLISVAQCVDGWYICQFVDIKKCAFRFDVAPDSALELQ